MSFWIFCLKCLTGALLTGVIIISSRETAHLGIGYHGMTKNVFRNGLQRFEESAHQAVEDFLAITLKLCLIKCSGSSRKNLQSGSVLIKFYFCSRKNSEEATGSERKQIEEKRGVTASTEKMISSVLSGPIH